MPKLSPKPDSHRPLLTWKDLDKRLQANITNGNPDKRFLVIKLADFEMSPLEIQEEAQKQGYIVSMQGHEHMRFE